MLGRLRALAGGRPAAAPRAHGVVPLAEYDLALKAALMALPERTQAAFAAACAERLYPAYGAFARTSGLDDEGLVRKALDLAWQGAKVGVAQEDGPSSLVERCLALIPDDEAEDAIPAHAEDAIASVAYALQAAAGLDPRAAGWAAQRVTNTLDDFVRSKDVDGSLPDAEQRVWEHPLIRTGSADARTSCADSAAPPTGPRLLMPFAPARPR
jgi:hypothetical protein